MKFRQSRFVDNLTNGLKLRCHGGKMLQFFFNAIGKKRYIPRHQKKVETPLGPSLKLSVYLKLPICTLMAYA